MLWRLYHHRVAARCLGSVYDLTATEKIDAWVFGFVVLDGFVVTISNKVVNDMFGRVRLQALAGLPVLVCENHLSMTTPT